jgi:hypothetical protein
MNWTNIKSHIMGAFKSWTMWFHSLVVTATLMVPILEQQIPSIAQYLPGKAGQNALLIVSVIGLLLRVKTATSLAAKVQAPTP